MEARGEAGELGHGWCPMPIIMLDAGSSQTHSTTAGRYLGLEVSVLDGVFAKCEYEQRARGGAVCGSLRSGG